MNFSFRPRSPTEQDDFDVLYGDEVIGTFFWKRNHPKPEDKVAIVRAACGPIGIVPNEKLATTWFFSKHLEAESPWAVKLFESLEKGL